MAENKSLNTLLAYKRDLLWYKKYCEAGGGRLFEEYLNSKGLKISSQSRIISAVRSFFSFLEEKGYKVSFREKMKAPLVKKHLPRFVTHGNFEKILEACKTEKKKAHLQKRDELVLHLFFGLALRVSELVSLNTSDYMDQNESIVITGKGRRQRVLPLTGPVLTLIQDYLETARPCFQTNKPSLILNNRGNRPSRVDVWRWIQKWCLKAGVKTSPHGFRHGCATELLDHGADLRTIQRILGHSSIETTKIYTHVSRSKMKKEVDQHHPLSKE